MANVWSVVGMLLVSVALGVSALICYYFLSKKSSILTKITLIVATIVSAFLAVMMIFVVSDYIDGNRVLNGEKFVNNIKIKYNVSEVISVNGLKNLYYVGHLADADELDIIVKTNDNVRFQFLVTVNPETSEPTLTDPPIVGGSVGVKNLGADELLKK